MDCHHSFLPLLKTMAMDHMKMAQDSMMKKDTKACTMHMQETMKAMK